MINILDYKTFDNNRLVYTDPTKVKGGSYIANVKYRNDDNELQDIVIQTPRLFCDSGIIKTDTRSYLELNFDKEHWLFYEFITDLDDHNIVIVEKNSESWFKQKFPLDVVEEFYKSPVKVGRGKNPPKIKIKLPLSRGKVECGIYDNKRQNIHYSEIIKSSKMICVLKLLGLRFLKQQVICEWVPIQISACDLQASIQSNYLIDESLLSDNEEVEDTEEVESVKEYESETEKELNVTEEITLQKVENETVSNSLEEALEKVVEESSETNAETTLETPVSEQVEISEQNSESEKVEEEVTTEVESASVEEVATEKEESLESSENLESPEYSERKDDGLVVENLDEEFLNNDDIEKIHNEKLELYEKNNKIAELSEKINFLELEISKKDELIDKFKTLLN